MACKGTREQSTLRPGIQHTARLLFVCVCGRHYRHIMYVKRCDEDTFARAKHVPISPAAHSTQPAPASSLLLLLDVPGSPRRYANPFMSRSPRLHGPRYALA